MQVKEALSPQNVVHGPAGSTSPESWVQMENPDTSSDPPSQKLVLARSLGIRGHCRPHPVALLGGADNAEPYILRWSNRYLTDN